MGSEDEASELRKRLTGALGTIEMLEQRLVMLEGTVFGCPACSGDHRATLVLQKLSTVRIEGGVSYDRGYVCPSTGRAVLLSEDGSSVVSP